MPTDVPITPRTAESIKELVRTGDVLAGKYRVERVIGVGGMGVVVAAMHLQLDQLVALKFLLPEPAKDPAVAARFSREARAAAKIRSEHVGRVIDVGTLDTGVPYIVMEYLEGSDLNEIVEKQGAMPSSLAVDYVLQACEAVAQAHAAGIVHRDLKPQNLFLAAQGDGSEIVKVLDFGISKSTSPDVAMSSKEASLTKTTDVFGSPLYMSPEQLKSSRDVDARADIWALGTILYELCTGHPPFQGASFAEIAGKILYQPVPPMARDDISPGLENVVMHCLEKQPEQRYRNVAELATALAPFGTLSAQESTTRVARVIRRAGLSLPDIEPGHGAGIDVGATRRSPSGTTGPTPADEGVGPTQAIPLTSPKGPAEGIPSPTVGQATSHAWTEAKLPSAGRAKVKIAFAVSAVAFVVVSATTILVLQGRGGSEGAPTPPTAEQKPSAAATVAATSEPQPTAAPASSGRDARPAGETSEPAVEPGYPVPPPLASATAAAVARPPVRGAKPGGSAASRPTPTAAATASPKPPQGKDGEFGGRK